MDKQLTKPVQETASLRLYCVLLFMALWANKVLALWVGTGLLVAMGIYINIAAAVISGVALFQAEFVKEKASTLTRSIEGVLVGAMLLCLAYGIIALAEMSLYHYFIPKEYSPVPICLSILAVNFVVSLIRFREPGKVQVLKPAKT